MEKRTDTKTLTVLMIWVLSSLALPLSGFATEYLEVELVGTLNSPRGGLIYGVTVQGDYAYVAAAEAGLLTVDISDSSNPVLIDTDDTPDWAWRSVIQGEYLYLADGSIGGLRIFDISDPEDPEETGFYREEVQRSSVRGVAIDGDYAYLACYFSGSLQIIDISDPADPQFVSVLYDIDSPYSVVIDGDYAFVAANSSFQIVDVSDPVNPESVGEYDPDEYIRVLDVALQDDYAYVADHAGDLLIFDVSDPTEPDLVSDVSTPYYPRGVYLVDDLIYVVDLSNLRIFNIADPLNPYLAGGDDRPTGARTLCVDGSLVYVANQNDLQIYHVSVIPTPPEPFDLITPEDSSIVTRSPVNLSWEPSSDPNPEDTVRYTVFWRSSRNVFHEDTGEDTSIVLDSLADDTDFEWKVRATDTSDSIRWSTQIWTFQTRFPEPPGDFRLLEPENGATMTVEEGHNVTAGWEESVDPDSGEYVMYNIYINVTTSGQAIVHLDYPGVAENQLFIDIPDSAGFQRWESDIEVHWWVEAVSDGDMVECEERFDFFIEPSVNVADCLFDGIPQWFNIVSTLPNPFNPQVVVTIALPKTAELNVSVYNVLGEQVAVLANNRFDLGFHKFTFHAEDQSSGIYFIRAVVPGKMNETRKVVLVR